MAPLPGHRWMEVEQVGDALVVRFTQARMLDEAQIQALGRQLLDLVDKDGCRKLVLNFARVTSLVSTMLAKLVMLHKRMKAAGGRLALCCFDANIDQTIRTLKLDRIFAIFPDEQEALQGLQ
jgi:anti-sigma B factor antagonist